MEQRLELGLIKNHHIVVNDCDLIIVRHPDSQLGGKRLKTLAVQLPTRAGFKRGTSGETLCDVKAFHAAVFGIRIGELGNNPLNFLKLILIIGEKVYILIFMFD